MGNEEELVNDELVNEEHVNVQTNMVDDDELTKKGSLSSFPIYINYYPQCILFSYIVHIKNHYFLYHNHDDILSTLFQTYALFLFL